jgi:hypothetical protein
MHPYYPIVNAAEVQYLEKAVMDQWLMVEHGDGIQRSILPQQQGVPLTSEHGRRRSSQALSYSETMVRDH